MAEKELTKEEMKNIKGGLGVVASVGSQPPADPKLDPKLRDASLSEAAVMPAAPVTK